MKTINKLTLLFTYCLTHSICLFAQISSTASSIGIDAKVIAPITIENTDATPLNFGTVTRSTTAGTVTVPTSGPRQHSGGVGLLGTTFSPAPFTVTGENSATFNIALPANGTITLNSGAESMPVSDFVHDMGSTPTLSLTGTASFVVGATLSVAANQPAGEYTNSFAVTVAYQ